MSAKLSVIVPVYNASPYLPQCLDTILLQSMSDFELICVDDGSTDGSLDILKTYTMFDERIKIIEGEHKGGAAARNKGLSASKGEFVLFLDADDFFHPDMFQEMLKKAEQDASDIVVCGYYQFDDKTQKDVSSVQLPQKYLAISPLKTEDFGSDLFTFSSPCPWNKLIRKDYIQKNKIFFDEAVYGCGCDDIMFSCLVLATANKISLIQDEYIHYRINNPTQQTQKENLLTFSNLMKTLSNGWKKLEELNISEKFLDAYLLRIKKSIHYALGKCIHSKKEALLSIKNSLVPELYNKLFVGKQVKMSIIIPVYNAEFFIADCLESVINQTLKDIEIICVDDGSTDNSLNILKEYAKRDDRIKVMTQENQGLPITRQNAMKIATGEYLQFLDADDYLDLEACECLYLYSKLYDLDMLSFAAIEFNNETKIEFEEPYHTLQWVSPDFLPCFTWREIKDTIHNIAVTACLTIYKYSFIKENRISWVHKKIAYEDTPFFIEAMLKNAQMGVFNEKFYHRRVHSEAITQNMNTNFSDYCWIVQYTLNKIKKLAVDNDVFIRYFYFFLNKTYRNYLKLPFEVQKKMMMHFYKLCLHCLKEYRYPLEESVRQFCQDYLQNKKLKNKIAFWYCSLLAQWALCGYSISLFNFKLKPTISLNVLGIPLIKKKNNKK